MLLPRPAAAVDVARSTATFTSGSASVVAGRNASLTILLRDASGAATSAYLPSLLNIAVFGHPASPLFMNSWTVGVVQLTWGGTLSYPSMELSSTQSHCNHSVGQCKLLPENVRADP